MPELPEVETIRRGILPHVRGRKVRAVVVRERRLRWPVPAEIPRLLPGATIRALERRGKYLLFRTDVGSLIGHLGMSGSLQVITDGAAPQKHDHVDIELGNGAILRYRDPRRFGCLLWTSGDPAEHGLLAHLGPEPLGDSFDAEHLFRCSRTRKTAVKTFIMNSRVVAGIGNIYANEVLFLAGIRPARAAGSVTLARYARLVDAIKTVLSAALAQGGTTLRDFVDSDGRPGYFRQQLNVYDHAGEPCPQCGRELRDTRLGQRSTVCCSRCQR